MSPMPVSMPAPMPAVPQGPKYDDIVSLLDNPHDRLVMGVPPEDYIQNLTSEHDAVNAELDARVIYALKVLQPEKTYVYEEPEQYIETIPILEPDNPIESYPIEDRDPKEDIESIPMREPDDPIESIPIVETKPEHTIFSKEIARSGMASGEGGMEGSLEAEAKKYKSAEEFVKAQGDKFESKLDKAMKQPYEMSQEEFGEQPLIKYIEDRLKDKNNKLNVKERNQLAEQLVEQGFMSMDDFNAMTGQHGFGGKVVPERTLDGKPVPSKPVEGDMGEALNYIGQWQTFTNVPLFAHRDSIVRALAEGKQVPKKVVDEYEKWKWSDINGTQVSLKEAVESYGAKFDKSLIIDKDAIKTKAQLTDIWNKAHK